MDEKSCGVFEPLIVVVHPLQPLPSLLLSPLAVAIEPYTRLLRLGFTRPIAIAAGGRGVHQHGPL